MSNEPNEPEDMEKFRRDLHEHWKVRSTWKDTVLAGVVGGIVGGAIYALLYFLGVLILYLRS